MSEFIFYEWSEPASLEGLELPIRKDGGYSFLGFLAQYNAIDSGAPRFAMRFNGRVQKLHEPTGPTQDYFSFSANARDGVDVSGVPIPNAKSGKNEVTLWMEHDGKRYGEIDFILTINDEAGVLNEPPAVTLNTPQSQTLFENDNLSIDGTAQDVDKGDVVIVKAKIADSRVINLSTKVSDGKPFDFANTFLIKQGRLWQGNNPITSVLDGAGYKIEVWAEDDKGGKSKVETRSFSVVANRPPIVKVTKVPSFTNITNSTRLEVAGTITDPDGHDVTMTVKLNDNPQEEIAVNQGEWNYIFEAASLKEGVNELTIVGRDEYGMSHTKTVRINNTIYKADMSHVPSVALFDIPLEGVESDGAVMWLRRKSDNTQFEARVATAGKKEEDFHEMQKTSHVVGNTPRDQFAGQTGVKTNNVTVEITSTGNHSLLMIQGVVK